MYSSLTPAEERHNIIDSQAFWLVVISSPLAFIISLLIRRYDWPFSYYVYFSLGVLVLTGLVKFALVQPPKAYTSKLSAKEEAVINSATD